MNSFGPSPRPTVVGSHRFTYDSTYATNAEITLCSPALSREPCFGEVRRHPRPPLYTLTRRAVAYMIAMLAVSSRGSRRASLGSVRSRDRSPKPTSTTKDCEALIEAMGAALEAKTASNTHGFFGSCGYCAPAQSL